MKAFTLLSGPIEGPIGALFARDPNLRTFRLREGAKIGDVIITDIRFSGDGILRMLAKRDFGKNARACAVTQGDISSTGAICSTRVYGEGKASHRPGRGLLGIRCGDDESPWVGWRGYAGEIVMAEIALFSIRWFAAP
jgi:hypothetical protein